MISSAQTTAAKPALPPAAQSSSPLPGPAAGAPSFAQFLTEQSVSPPAPPQQQPDEAPRDPAGTARPATSAESSAASPNSPAAQARRAAAANAKPAGQTARAPKTDEPSDTAHAARAAQAAGAAQAAQAAQEATEAGIHAAALKTEAEPLAAQASAATDEEELPQSPELKEFTQLIGMAPPAPANLPDAVSKPDLSRKTAAAATDDTEGSRRAQRNVTLDTGAAPDPAAAAPAVKPAADKAQARHTADTLSTTSSAQASKESAAPPPATTSTPSLPSFAAVLAQALPAQAAVVDTAAVTQAPVQAPLNSSAFAPELGTRVSLMAVDGVQHAELQLNPAEMGPVSVQIVLDGSQAQVSFHAAQAETRQALEQSLPDLAAALQGQGLTLSGGGVFQQAQRDAGHGQEGAQADGRTQGNGQGNARAGHAAATTSAPLRRSVGLLDTFA